MQRTISIDPKHNDMLEALGISQERIISLGKEMLDLMHNQKASHTETLEHFAEKLSEENPNEFAMLCIALGQEIIFDRLRKLVPDPLYTIVMGMILDPNDEDTLKADLS